MEATRPLADKVAARASAAAQVYANTMTLGFEQARVAYEQAQQAYGQELQSLQAELDGRVQHAWRSYLETLSGAYTAAPSYEACMNDYRAYLERMQALFGNPALGEQQKAAYERYLSGLAAAGQDSGQVQAVQDGYRSELEAMWGQAPLREELSALQARYAEQLNRLAGEAWQRQSQAWEDFLGRLREIWAPKELQARSEAALERLLAAAREALVNCHAAVEKSSAKAIEELTADKA